MLHLLQCLGSGVAWPKLRGSTFIMSLSLTASTLSMENMEVYTACEYLFKNLLKYFIFPALSDDILHCVLKRGGKYLTSLDLSSTPKQITDRGLNLIGQ